MWLCGGLVCCDLEGSSHGAVELCEMRGTTTGTAAGKEKKKRNQTLSNCAFSPIFWSSQYKHFPSVRILTHYFSFLCLSRSATTISSTVSAVSCRTRTLSCWKGTVKHCNHKTEQKNLVQHYRRVECAKRLRASGVQLIAAKTPRSSDSLTKS